MMRVESPGFGYFVWETNEASAISTVADPPAFRLASPSGLGLGKISGNRLRPDGRQDEMGLWQFKQDERTRTNPDSRMGEVTLHLNDGSGDSDAAMRPVVTFRHDGITFHVPVTLPNGQRYP